MLKALYDATNAGAMLGITATKFYDLMVDLDIPKNEVESARTWLERRGFVTSPAINYIGITHAGIAAYEATESKPAQGTAHFPASVINNVFNIGSVGGIQTGSHNTMTVKQTDKRQSADLDVIFQALRSNIAALPDPVREDATVIANELEKQTRSDNPSIPIIKSYVGTLETNSSECGTNARAAMEWVLKNYCR
jgi:hypothetical protein